MNKTDIEKAGEIAKSCIKIGDNYIIALATAPLEAAIKMAEWKEQQMIEKAAEWLEKNVIDDFKKAMKQ